MKSLKRIFGFVVCAFMMAVLAMPVNAKNYKLDDWQKTMPESEGTVNGKGYNAGSATPVEDTNKIIIKGNSYAGNKETGADKWVAMHVGPYVKGDNTTIATGIKEELQIGLDVNKLASQKFFEISFSLKDKTGAYVNEVNIITENVGGEIYIGIQNINISGGIWGTPIAKVTTSGIYTYTWELTKKTDGSYIIFSVVDETGKVVGKSEELNIDTTFNGPQVQEISTVGAENVSVRWIWFCNVQTENGVEVYYNTEVVVAPEVTGEDVTVEEEVTDVLTESLAAEATEDEELKELLDNYDVTIGLETEKLDEETLEPEEVSKFEEALEGATVTDYFDLSIVVRADGVDKYHLPNLNKEITLTVSLPELPAIKDGYKRTFYILREHNGKVTVLDATLTEDGNSLTFASDKFSTYALAYLDEAIVDENTENPKTGDNIVAFMGLASISLLGLGVAVRSLRKENN